VSHRQRRVAGLTIFLVVLALFLNGMLNKQPVNSSADQNPAPVGQPAAVYVPQHVQVVAPIPPDATAAQVASGFVAAYLTYDTTAQTLDQHLATLPHPGPGFVAALTSKMTQDWTTWTGQRTVSKLIGTPSVSMESSDPTGVVMDVLATASVTAGSGYSPASSGDLHLKMVQENSQWVVIDVTEAGQ
jgi:hypothetical protein